MSYYQGKFAIRNPQKYIGDRRNIIYRSSWELYVFRWLDKNDAVVRWTSEEIVIPYICATDRKWHRYYLDLYIEFKDGTKLAVEIKPERYLQPPKKRKSRRYIQESLNYMKNRSKWKYANIWAEKNNIKFQIWTETVLEELGIMNVQKRSKKFKIKR